MADTVPLTVAIPTYNRRNKVRSLCEQVLAQLRPGDELVVSDNASTDGTAQTLAALPGVTVQAHPSSLGMVGNWNYCLTAGSHDWVCLIHSDDRLRPGGLDAIRRTCAAAAGSPALVAHGEWEAREPFVDNTLCYVVREPGASACLRAEFCASGVTMHRAVVDAVGRFDPAFAYSSDMEYFARVCARFPSYVIHNPGVIEYVTHGENYQLETWRKSDFLDQLRAVEAAGIAHAALPTAQAQRILEQRLARDARHMLRMLRGAGDTAQVRKLSRAVGGLPGLGRRMAIAAQFGKRLGWFPKGLLK